MATVNKLIMIGPAADLRSGIASLAGVWREHGLFRRWAVEYVATRAATTPAQNARVLGNGLRAFADALARGRVALHAHLDARAGMWRESLFLAVAAATRAPVILQLHGGGFERFYDAASTPLRAVVRQALERAACVVVPCESLRAWTRSVTRTANVVIVPPAVSMQAVRRTPEKNLVVFMGALRAEKGIFDLLEALAAVRRSLPDIRLVCAGEGARDPVGRFAARLGIADAVRFTGTVGPSGKRALLESAAVAALPSYAEGLPASLLEAMGAGVPAIASPVGGIPEVIADGTSGILVAAGDKHALARAIVNVLSSKALSEKLGGAARETVRARFSPERSLAQLEDLYADLGLRSLGEPAAAPQQGGLRQAA